MRVLSLLLFAAFNLNCKIILTIFPQLWPTQLMESGFKMQKGHPTCCFRKRVVSSSKRILLYFGNACILFLSNPVVHFLCVSSPTWVSSNFLCFEIFHICFRSFSKSSLSTPSLAGFYSCFEVAGMYFALICSCYLLNASVRFGMADIS